MLMDVMFIFASSVVPVPGTSKKRIQFWYLHHHTGGRETTITSTRYGVASFAKQQGAV